MRTFRLLTLLLLLSSGAMAQTRLISGTIKDAATGNGLPSVTVKVKDHPTSTVTNADGSFSLNVPEGAVTLEVSSVGYNSKSVVADASSTSISITLETASAELSEVVVTALGVKRERKALTYASQQIDGNELRRAANTNFVNALSGKMAGLDIKISNSGAGGSTKAVLRGNKSLLGLSEALYVIDGIPLVNNKSGQPGSYGGTDGGDGLSAINQADIESINVLRGSYAAILYGSQGANGVILITTKKGRAGKMAIDFNNSTMFDQVSGLPDFQYRYGTVGGDYSWTPAGQTAVKSDNYQKNYINDFFKTGATVITSVAIHGGTDKTAVYFSYQNTSAN